MKNKRKYFLGLLIFVLAFFTFDVKVFAIPDSDQPEVFLYGFGDDYDGGGFLTPHTPRTCHVALNNIPISERKNVKLTIDNKDIAEIQSITYSDDNHAAITAIIKGKKLGTAHIIASLTYKGVTYISKITTTVRESNYQIILSNDNFKGSQTATIKIKETLKMTAFLVAGSLHIGDITSKGVVWSSSNEKVLSVNNSGLVTAVGEGTASIIAKYKTEEGVTISNSYKIEVKGNKKSNNSNNKNNTPSKTPVEKSKVNTLSDVKISNVGNFEFVSNEANYNIEVESNVKEVEIKSTLTDAKSKYVDGYGNRKIELKEGNNKIEIKVQAENGDIGIYTFNIIKKSSQTKTTTNTSKQKSNNYALPIAVFGIGVISITAAIIYKKKQSL